MRDRFEPIEVPLEGACVEALALDFVPRLAVFHPLRLRREGILESCKRLAAVPKLDRNAENARSAGCRSMATIRAFGTLSAMAPGALSSLR